MATVHIVEMEVRQVQETILSKFGAENRQNLRQETEADAELRLVKKAVSENWTNVKRKIAERFGKCRNSFSIVEGTLMFNDRDSSQAEGTNPEDATPGPPGHAADEAAATRIRLLAWDDGVR